MDIPPSLKEKAFALFYVFDEVASWPCPKDIINPSVFSVWYRLRLSLFPKNKKAPTIWHVPSEERKELNPEQGCPARASRSKLPSPQPDMTEPIWQAAIKGLPKKLSILMASWWEQPHHKMVFFSCCICFHLLLGLGTSGRLPVTACIKISQGGGPLLC